MLQHAHLRLRPYACHVYARRYACIVALEASLHADIDTTWLGSDLYNFCTGSKPSDDGKTTALVDPSLPGCDELGTGDMFVAAYSWSLMLITGTGGTDFYPSSNSRSETIVVTILVVLGALMWTCTRRA